MSLIMVNFCSQYSYGSHVNGETSTGGQDFAEAGPGGSGGGGQPGGASLRAGGVGAVGGGIQSRRRIGGLAYARGLGAAVGPAGGRLGGVSVAGPTRLAQGCPGHAPPKEGSEGAGGLEKKLPETLAALLKPEAVLGRQVRLMFQDEARFGRMVRIRRCWAPSPQRPVVANGYEREFVYGEGTVSPIEGELDWMICRQMNTERMGAYLAQVSAAHAQDFMLMIVDGASSHVSKDLQVPENIRLVRLPPYAPELNPQEHVWDELREKEFPNRVFAALSSVVRQLETGLPRLAANTKGLRSLPPWPWIISLNLNAI